MTARTTTPSPLLATCLLALLACGNTAGEQEAPAPPHDHDVEARIRDLGITLGDPGKPLASYVHAVRSGNLLFLAGKGPRDAEGTLIRGKVGTDLTVEQGYEAARFTAIEQLAALKAEIGDLNKVERIVKVLGMVNADASFTDHPEVVNGFSDLMVEVFGERGRHARSAVGTASLPRNMAVEVEMIVQVRD